MRFSAGLGQAVQSALSASTGQGIPVAQSKFEIAERVPCAAAKSKEKFRSRAPARARAHHSPKSLLRLMGTC